MSPAEEMQMQVKDRLPGVGVGVEDEAITRIGHTFTLRELARETGKLTNHRWILHGGHGGNVLARNYENMHWRLRIDVAERDTVFRLGNDFGRDLLADDPAEEARVGHVPSE